jgi:hypothetical protein
MNVDALKIKNPIGPEIINTIITNKINVAIESFV